MVACLIKHDGQEELEVVEIEPSERSKASIAAVRKYFCEL